MKMIVALLRNLNRQETGKVRKSIIGVFKDIGFSLEIETNLKEIDSIDVSLNLRNGTYRPYKKPNDMLLYIHSLSKHPSNWRNFCQSKFRIPSKKDCRKTRLMRRYSTQQNVNTKMLWRKMGSKFILNTPKINDKNQKIDLEIIFGLTHHSTKQYTQILQKCFFNWSIDIFQSFIDHI